MNFLGRALSMGSRFVARATPVARFIARETPGALQTVARFSSSPLATAVAQRIGGVTPTVLSRLSGGVNNALGAINLLPQVRRDISTAVQAGQAGSRSLAQLMQTARGTGNGASG